MTPEGYEKQQVKAFLKSLGAYQFWPVQMGYGAATIDCLACINGRFVGIEVKKKDYRPSDITKRQAVILNQIDTAKGEIFVGDADQIIENMKAWLANTR